MQPQDSTVVEEIDMQTKKHISTIMAIVHNAILYCLHINLAETVAQHYS